MTNLDSVLKSRDIILLTQVHRVKAVTFPEDIYGCENWTIKKTECQKKLMLLNCGAGEDFCLGLKIIKPVDPKGN